MRNGKIMQRASLSGTPHGTTASRQVCSNEAAVASADVRVHPCSGSHP